jgi:hypothetical protein
LPLVLIGLFYTWSGPGGPLPPTSEEPNDAGVNDLGETTEWITIQQAIARCPKCGTPEPFGAYWMLEKVEAIGQGSGAMFKAPKSFFCRACRTELVWDNGRLLKNVHRSGNQ